LEHLRFPASLFLAPLFFFSICQIPSVRLSEAVALCAILSLGIYPASHGYNSFFDQDEQSIMGLEFPKPVRAELYFYAWMIEILACMASYFFFGLFATFFLVLYGVMSKLYSHPRIRLKKRPWVSLVGVFCFQGVGIYGLCVFCLDADLQDWLTSVFWQRALAAGLFVAAVYPMTQVYQHEQDSLRGDLTVSRVLGVRGTFLFSSVLLAVSTSLVCFCLEVSGSCVAFLTAIIPSGLYFVHLTQEVWKNPQAAQFKSIHRFLKLSAWGCIFGFTWVMVRRRFS
jgi:1,4-dihydroxy-2-naphthoate octaprenyltransferase